MQLYRDELNALLTRLDPRFSASYPWAWITGSPDAPELNHLIELACRDADHASMLDKLISTLLSVVTNDPEIERKGATEIKNMVHKNGEPIGLIAVSDKFIARSSMEFSCLSLLRPNVHQDFGCKCLGNFKFTRSCVPSCLA